MDQEGLISRAERFAPMSSLAKSPEAKPDSEWRTWQSPEKGSWMAGRARELVAVGLTSLL